MGLMSEFQGTVILYVSVMLACLLCAKIAQSWTKRGSILLVWVVIIGLSLLAGLRAPSVGIDTQNYIRLSFNIIKAGHFDRAYGPEGYKALVWLVYRFTEDDNAVLFVIALVTNALILLRFWEMRDRASFTLMVFFYFAHFYFAEFNIFRQYLAMAVVFYGSRYVFKHRYLTFSVFVAAAISVHSISVLALLFIPIDFMFLNTKSRLGKYRVLLITITPVVAFIGYTLFMAAFGDLYERRMVEGAQVDVGFMVFFQVMMLGFVRLFLFDKKDKRLARREERCDNYLREIALVYLFGLLFTFTTYFFRYGGRSGMIFMLYESVFMAYDYQQPIPRLMTRFIYVLVGLYVLFQIFSTGSQGVMPYIPYWR